MRCSQPRRPPFGRVPSIIHCGRAAALNSGFLCARRCVQQSSRAATWPPPDSFSPVPPASRNGRRTARAARRRGRAPGFCHLEGTGKTKTPAFLMACTRKSLIPETNAATSCAAFATSHSVFATSPFFAPVAIHPFFSLSKSLNEKKKEGLEGAENSSDHTPRVDAVLPSFAGAASFLGHELQAVQPPD